MSTAGRDTPRLEAAELRALGERLRRVSRFLRSYSRWKVRMDPVYALALSHLAGASEVVDLGSGIGLLPVLLAQRASHVKVMAVEWDPRKVSAARELAQGLAGIDTVQGDARTATIPSCDAVVLFDILHYSDAATQREWLKRAAASLRPGGKLLVRELDGNRSSASLLERLAVRVGWNQADGVRPRPAREIAGDLKDLGLDVQVEPAGRGVFGANVLLVATKNVKPLA